MSVTRNDIFKLLARADSMADGPMRVATCEEAIRSADQLGDIELQLETRHELIRSAFMDGEADKLFVAISWCLAQAEITPDRINWLSLLWQCKFALNYVTCFPDISLQQISELQQSIIDLYNRRGASLRGPYVFILRNCLALGDHAKAKEMMPLWRLQPVDTFTPRTAWEDYHLACFYFEIGEPDKAINLANRWLHDPTDRVHYSCVKLIGLELFRRGELQRAADLYRQMSRYCNGKPQYADDIAMYMAFLALTRNFDTALRLFEQNLSDRLNVRLISAHLRFDLHAWILFRQLLQAQREEISLHLPESFPLQKVDGIYRTAEICDWFESKVRSLAQRYDTRAGNSYQAEVIERTLSHEQHAVDFPV